MPPMGSMQSMAALMAFSFLMKRNMRPTWNALWAPSLPLQFPAEGCELVNAPGVKYCEDLTEWRGGAVVSCDPGRREWNTVMGSFLDPSGTGGLYHLSPSGSSIKPIELVSFPGAHFHPLGLTILEDGAPSGQDLMAVVNHKGEGATVELFELKKDKAKWLKTLPDDGSYMRAPNGVHFISKTELLVTHDHLYTKRAVHAEQFPVSLAVHAFNLGETVLALPLSSVESYSFDLADPKAQASKKVAFSSMSFPNGVAGSKDGKWIAIAQTTLQTVELFARNTTSGETHLIESLQLPFNVDNLSIDESSPSPAGYPTIIAAGHPHFPSLLKHIKSDSNPAPSWVVRMHHYPAFRATNAPERRAKKKDSAPYSVNKRSMNVNWEVTTIYQSSGGAEGGIDASTGGVALKDGRIAITGLYSPGVLICPST